MTIPGKSRTEITITRTHDRYSFGPSLHLANDLITANQTEQRIQLDETPQPRNKIPHKTRSAATNETKPPTNPPKKIKNPIPSYKQLRTSQENQEPNTNLPRKSRTGQGCQLLDRHKHWTETGKEREREREQSD